MFKQSILFLLILAIAEIGYNDDDDCAYGCGYAGPDDDGRVDSVVIVAICVVNVAVRVPFGAISVVVAAFIGTVLILTVGVVPHW